jgi:hypothetical protein
METVEAKLGQFFDAYAQRFNDALEGKGIDVEATVNAFAECFVEASPVGIVCGKNDEQFRDAIPKGFEFYRSIGTKSMQIESKEIAILDSFHSMVKVHWVATYKKGNDKNDVIEFDVFYFVQTINDSIKIFAYITGDEQKVLKERGLM